MMPNAVGEYNPKEQQDLIVKSAELYSLEGFYCIPLKYKDKKPRFKGWQQAKGSVDHALTVIRNETQCNLGIVLGAPSKLVDLDLDAPEVRALAPLLLPDTGMKIQKAGEITHYMYACENPGKTRKFQLPKTDDDDGGMLLELRADGGQTMVPPSIHPNGVRLQWAGEYEGARSLEYTVLETQCRYVASAALIARYIASGVFHDAMLSVAGGLYYAGTNFKSAKRIIMAIAEISGMENIGDRLNGLKSTYEKGAAGDGLRAWESLEEFGFSPAHIRKLKTWLPYSEAAFEEVVQKTREEKNKKAEEGAYFLDFDPLIGPAPMVESQVELIGRFPAMRGENKVLDLMAHPAHCKMPLEVFKRIASTYKEQAGKSVIPGYKIWADANDVAYIDHESFAPGQPRIYETAGRLIHNTCYIKKHPPAPADSSNRLALFHAHMELLFPEKIDRELFIDWLAFNIQQPARRSLFTPLHISHYHGLGRSWLGSLLWELLGDGLVVSAHMQDIMEGQFNSYLNRSLVCVIDEIAGHQKYTANERLRTILSETKQEVNVKYGTKETKSVHTNFLMFSNHADPIKITEEDRRIWVVRAAARPQTGDYYKDLYRWQENELHIAALYAELAGRNLERFLGIDRAPMTPAKLELIQNTQTGPEMVIREFVAEFSDKIEIVAHSTLLNALEVYARRHFDMVGVFDELKAATLRNIFNEAGLRTVGKRRMIRKISTNLQQPWALSQELSQKWSGEDRKVPEACVRAHEYFGALDSEFDPVTI